MSLTLAYLPAPFVSVVMVRLLRCTGNGMSNIVTSPGAGIHRWRGTRSRDQSWAASRRVSSNAEVLGGKGSIAYCRPKDHEQGAHHRIIRRSRPLGSGATDCRRTRRDLPL